MSESIEKPRRQFLKNLALGAMAAGTLPMASCARTKDSLALPADNQMDCDPTTLDYYGQGPFYTANAP